LALTPQNGEETHVDVDKKRRRYLSSSRDFSFYRDEYDCDNPENTENGFNFEPYYVSSLGKDSVVDGWGLSKEKPFNTIQYAIQMRRECQTIYVMPGVYRNKSYGDASLNHNRKVVSLHNVSNLRLLGYSNGDGEIQMPVLEFDGPGGIVGGGTSLYNIEISGFEIRGPNDNISYQEAFEDRLVKNNYYNGRGIAIWRGHHIYIHDNMVHHCPASGIRVNKGDYIFINNNLVYSNTWWSSSAESAIVIAEAQDFDMYENRIKMKINNNVVFDNINKIPYYNPKYAWDYSPISGRYDCGSFIGCQEGDHVQGDDEHNCPWQCRYGHENQDYIIDGMGVYFTRNRNSYLYGQMEAAYNIAYGNGINGVVVHETNRVTVRRNKIYLNGVVPRLEKMNDEYNQEDWHIGCSGKSRQPYSGIVLNKAQDVKLWSNNVQARFDDDFAFKLEGSSSVLVGGNNRVCGNGKIDDSLTDIVREESDLSVCGM
jgi:hypothetical protein